VGERKDSQTYVRMKRKACAEVGIKSIDVDLPGDAPEEKVLDAVLDLNVNPHVHGILKLPSSFIEAVMKFGCLSVQNT
jgi:5,10-methylene-tetrahydrofolate dehydrogenase/methenyl tetrahydrofolate cyclohydrolase